MNFFFFSGKEIKDVKNFFSNFENTFNNLKNSLSSIPSSIGQSLESLVGDIGGKLSKCRVPISLFLLVPFPKVCLFSSNVRLCTVTHYLDSTELTTFQFSAFGRQDVMPF